MKVIGKELQKVRKQKGISIYKMDKEKVLTTYQVKACESGSLKINVGSYFIYAKYLGLNLVTYLE